MMQPDYSHIQQLLVQERSLTDAAEAHGTLAGCLCAASGYRFEDWLREILPEGHAAPAAAATLRELYTATAGALLQQDFEFELLLPDGCAADRCAHRGARAVVPGIPLRPRSGRHP